MLMPDRLDAGGSPAYEVCSIMVPPQLQAEIAAFCRSEASRTFVLFLSGLIYMLDYFMEEKRVVVGVHAMGSREDVTMNEFIPLPLSVNKQQSFKTLLNEIAGHLSAALEHQHFPMEMLLQEGEKKGTTELFDIAFTYDALQKVETVTVPDINLFFQLCTNDGALCLSLRYNRLRYAAARMEQLLAYALNSVSLCIRELDKPLLAADFILPKEKTLITSSFNQPVREDVGPMFPEAFRQCVATFPEEAAVVYGSRRISYRELDQLSDVVAGEIKRKGIRNGQIVVTFGDRSPEQLAIMLGILKCGAVLSVLDPAGAPQRTEKIIRDAGPALLIATRKFEIFVSRFETLIPQILLLPDELQPEETDMLSGAFETILPEDPAYIIYTSGTTGQPKGVILTHTGLQNHLLGVCQVLNFSPKDVFAQTAACSFDIFIMQYFLALTTGGTTHIIEDDDILDPGRFLCELNRIGTTIVELVPSYIETLLDMLEKEKDLCPPSLKWLISTGDALSLPLAKKWLEAFPASRILNAYGPAEASDDVCTYILDRDNIDGHDFIPIGKPLQNVRLLVLDENLKLCPLGRPGMIYVGGLGLGKGYLNDPVKTRHSFLTLHTIHQTSYQGMGIYKTGDIGYWLPDGNLVFSGRKDWQVKVNGVRIELSEIEKVLEKMPDILVARAVLRKDEKDRKSICVYFQSDKKITQEAVRKYMRECLPGHMMPSHFIQLESFPVTSNGKIDISSLPAPEQPAQREILVPTNEKERAVHKVWMEVLGLQEISIRDNYFMLGGDSIKSIQIVSKLYREKYRIRVKDIFNNPTIRESAITLVPIDGHMPSQEQVSGAVRLNPVQIDFFRQFKEEPCHHHYNQAILLHSGEQLDAAVLKLVFEKMVQHHDALRMVFSDNGQEIRQVNLSEIDVAIKEYDLRDQLEGGNDLLRYCNEVHRSMNLQDGPLIRVALFRLADGDRLLISVHHLVIDGISWRIIFEDLCHLYKSYKEGKQSALPLKTDSFKSWNDRLKAFSEEGISSESLRYWRRLFSDVPDFPDERESLSVEKGGYLTENISLNKLLTTKLLGDANRSYGTAPQELMLAGLSGALEELWGIHDMIVHLEGHGREEVIGGDISRTIGWFTSVYPVRFTWKRKNIVSVITGVKESLRKVPHHGIEYGLIRYLRGEDIGPASFDLLFNYLGEFDASFTNEIFSIAKESAGDTQAPALKEQYGISINCLVEDGCLRISLSYNPELYSIATIRLLLTIYQETLQTIITHCDSQVRSVRTPTDFMYKELTEVQLSDILEQYDVQDIYPLSPMQEGMLFLSLLNPSSGAYLEQISYRIKGALDKEVIQKCMQSLTERHDILRTAFVHEGMERPLQVVLTHREIIPGFFDIREASDPDEMIESFKMTDRNKLFDLALDTLMRVNIFQVSDVEYEFIWSHHHILMDGWCMSIIVEEFLMLYRYYSGKGSYQESTASPYKNYITWLSQQPVATGKLFWEKYLSDYQEELTVPGCRSGEPDAFIQQEITYQLDERRTAALNRLAGKNNVTLSTVVHVLWGILLSKCNNVKDVVFGSVVSGRPADLPGVESILGLFINTVPVRIDTAGKIFTDLLRSTRDHFLESEQYHHIALNEIQALSLLKTALIDHILVFENYPLLEELSRKGTDEPDGNDFTIYRAEAYEQTNYDLTITVSPGEKIQFDWAFNQHVYHEKDINRLSGWLFGLIDQVIDNPEVAVMDLELTTEEERRQLLQLSAGEKVPFEQDKLVQEVFEEQVMLHGREPALVYEEGSLTYEELNIKANRLAHYLRAKGITPGQVVGICIDRSMDMVIAVLAVIKAGGAYLPVDPTYPDSRVRYMLEDSKTVLLLTNSKQYQWHENAVDPGNAEVMTCSGENPAILNTTEDLLYLIYTSGSTGVPKGVMVQQQQFLNATYAWRKCYGLASMPVSLLQMASVAFDVFSGDLSRALLNGGKMVICPQEARLDPAQVYQLIRKESISIFEATPSLVIPLMDFIMEQRLETPSLRMLIFGADVCRVDEFRKVTAFYGPQVRVINSYGVTEATIDTSYFEGDLSGFMPDDQVPVGLPMPNMEMYILDEQLHLLPAGVAGELYIGGRGVGKGYLGKEELTAMRFIDNPYQKGGKMYKTGDRCSWLDNGNISFLGRGDEQVKIRGFRIEPREIENALMKCPGIRNTLVTTIGQKGKPMRLCAYYIAADEIPAAVINEQLIKILPPHMIPDNYVQMEQFPLSPNGKIDKRLLPVPAVHVSAAGRLAENDLEILLTAIWGEVLVRQPAEISVTDNFFGIGGDSIKIMHIKNKVLAAIKKNITIAKFFEFPTIETFCRHLQSDSLPSHDLKSAMEEEGVNMLTETLNLIGNGE